MTPDNENKKQVRKEMQAKIEQLRKMFDEFAAQNLPKKEPKAKSLDNDIMFFSLDPNDCIFPPNPKTEWAGSACQPPDEITINEFEDELVEQRDSRDLGHVSPDLKEFLMSAGMLLYDALYVPYKNQGGRLSQLFVWLDAARGKMSQDDFTDADRKAFRSWCIAAAKTLQECSRRGLWLSDTEDDFVAAMASGEIMEGKHNDEDNF